MTIEKYYRSKGIAHIVNHEIDYDEEQKMFKDYAEAAQRLNNLINDRGLKVYLHDTSSITRAPTLTVIYMCLFLRHQDWQNPDKVEKYVKQFHPLGEPNMYAVRKVIELYKHI